MNVNTAVAAYQAKHPTINGRPDQNLIDALQKVSPQAQAKTRKQSEDFEAMFINTMFSQMTSGIKGEGPFGDTTGTGAWRSMLTDEYSRSFAKAGGVGISNEVFRSLIIQQANRAS
ncbi:flagellar assembly peptidoglycan hydrolase FlgJ [Tardiphaga sp. P9-11]|jgi:Rod binding domain-containing protein|uniref:flagellar assembly peptidoglycan hydrolase FlgJ n=1 Tax=Tardiphaga sp. P9-11 TaxID=2024614 RepID=UPI0011F1071E|nr:flagellar assembly peptidoglycan hydrolase FlgJ [Tardiphaga sp. P9-11]KAA0076724.1 flagellar rod assembly protein FlgJ [Tardiphaga sp. P9-11]